MSVLNLTNSETSSIKYLVSHFPDGQQNLTIKPRFSWKAPEINDNEVTIKSRLNNWSDLEIICCAVASLRELGVKSIHLYVPFFCGSRSDRKFEEGGNNYLKSVICPVINSLKFDSVTVLDPHSNVLEACIDNFRSVDNSRLVDWALRDIYKTKSNIFEFGNNYEYPIFVSSDNGASHKIYKLLDKLANGLPYGNVITCSKERDNEGKLTKCVVPLGAINNKKDREKDYIIIDDVGDRFGTFINIAKEIDRQYIDMDYNAPKKYLIVTHSIQDEGIKLALEIFDGVYTTNSYKDRKDEEDFKVLNVF